jgi:hypothetical protein
VVGVAALVHGTHAWARFTDEARKRSVVSAFVAAGLRRDERVAVYTRAAGGAGLLPGSIGEAGTARLVESGQLVLASAEDAYFGEQGFDAEGQVAEFAAFTDATVAEGYSGLRVFADNGWMPAALDDPRRWVDYELQVSRMMAGRPLIGLCGFDVADEGPVSPRTIDAVHRVNVPGDGPDGLFRVVRDRDAWALRGELESFVIDELQEVLEALRPLLGADQLSLRGLQFVDAATARTLFAFVEESGVAVRDVSAQLAKVWRLLGLQSA